MAGVGKTTVSRVINGAHKVSPETLERINAVIRELGYHPSQAARSLKGEGTKTIGLVLPSIADPFFAGCAEAAQEAARSRGYLLVVAATNYDAQMEIYQLESLIRHRVEGILLAPADGRSRRLTAVIDSLKVPLVTLNHPFPKSRFPGVVCDNRAGARAATEHLIGHGYRRILCLGGESGLYSISERQIGYLKAMQSAGLTPSIEGSANDYAEVEAVLKLYLRSRKKIDAVFAVRNSITIYAFQAMQALGVKIPDEIALAGFDDFDLACTLRPAVTVVRQPVTEIGSQAAHLLFQQLQSASSRVTSSPGKRLELKTTLIVRNSCGCK
jgi:LacI family transcriptional regulator